MRTQGILDWIYLELSHFISARSFIWMFRYFMFFFIRTGFELYSKLREHVDRWRYDFGGSCRILVIQHWLQSWPKLLISFYQSDIWRTFMGLTVKAVTLSPKKNLFGGNVALHLNTWSIGKSSWFQFVHLGYWSYCFSGRKIDIFEI